MFTRLRAVRPSNIEKALVLFYYGSILSAELSRLVRDLALEFSHWAFVSTS